MVNALIFKQIFLKKFYKELYGYQCREFVCVDTGAK